MKHIWIFAVAAMLATPAAAYVSGDGHNYNLTCLSDGYVLSSEFPVTRLIDNSAAATSATGTETIFLGADCRAAHGIFGVGEWCWANGGFLAAFKDYEFGFARQELFCEPVSDISDDGRCPC